jgi:hypothetical protein
MPWTKPREEVIETAVQALQQGADSTRVSKRLAQQYYDGTPRGQATAAGHLRRAAVEAYWAEQDQPK